MNTSIKTLVAGCTLLVACTLVAADAAKVDLKDVKCVVSGGAAKEAGVADYKKAKVYFCCNNCPKAFVDANGAVKPEFVAKANHQLVQTKQFVQTLCPLAGKKVNDAKSTVINGVTVKFCCDGCKGTVEKASDAEKLDMVFNDKTFDKSFSAPKK